jgi:adenylate cyclase class 2
MADDAALEQGLNDGTMDEDDSRTETELKIPVEGLDDVRRRLETAGAELRVARQREVNILFDRPDGSLYREGRALRLRRYGARWILTHKGPARFEGQVKHREELEVEVQDGETVSLILERLGLVPWVRYEKDREMWRLQSEAAVEVCLDHTPLGDFVELEGPAPMLGTACTRLGLEADRAVRCSYVALWDEHRARHPEAPRDMVFEP